MFRPLLDNGIPNFIRQHIYNRANASVQLQLAWVRQQRLAAQGLPYVAPGTKDDLQRDSIPSVEVRW
jgi:hypothetical protein